MLEKNSPSGIEPDPLQLQCAPYTKGILWAVIQSHHSEMNRLDIDVRLVTRTHQPIQIGASFRCKIL